MLCWKWPLRFVEATTLPTASTKQPTLGTWSTLRQPTEGRITRKTSKDLPSALKAGQAVIFGIVFKVYVQGSEAKDRCSRALNPLYNHCRGSSSTITDSCDSILSHLQLVQQSGENT